MTGSEEVALVLSMAACNPSCTADPNYNPANLLGSILYNGPYNPQPHPEDTSGWKPFYQNFSIEVPTGFTSGEQVALIATHLNLVGVS